MGRGTVLATALAATLAAGPAGAEAGRLNGSQLRTLCTSADESLVGVCIGYVVGIADALGEDEVAQRRACVPLGRSDRQLVQVVVHWLERNPDADYYWARAAVASALASAYPCQ